MPRRRQTSQEDGAGLDDDGIPEPVAREMSPWPGFSRFTVHDAGNPLNAFYEVRPWEPIGASRIADRFRAICARWPTSSFATWTS